MATRQPVTLPAAGSFLDFCCAVLINVGSILLSIATVFLIGKMFPEAFAQAANIKILIPLVLIIIVLIFLNLAWTTSEALAELWNTFRRCGMVLVLALIAWIVLTKLLT